MRYTIAGFMLTLALQGLAAQEPPKPAPTPRPEGWHHRSDAPEAFVQVFTNRRARLGVSVNLRARDTDSIGAYINSVTPGGPAAKAGLRSGDIITRLGGTSLLDDSTTAERGRSAPGLRLTELAAQLDPNATIAVEFRRGKERSTVSLITGDEPSMLTWNGNGSFGYAFGDDSQEAMRRVREGMERSFFVTGESLGVRLDTLRALREHSNRMRVHEAPFFFSMGSPLADLELAPINPDLGRYFGVTEGILVINVPDDSGLHLKAGDVVLSVDGREPASPAHLLRILRSYDNGEAFKLEVMRMKKKETITAAVGEK